MAQRRANARNVRPYYPHWQYTDLFIFRFESKNGLFPSSCRDFANHHAIPDRLCETCSNSCALVAILSLAYLVLVRVLTCLLSTKKIRNVAVFILTRLTILTITYADRSRPTRAISKRVGLRSRYKLYTEVYSSKSMFTSRKSMFICFIESIRHLFECVI